MFITFINSYIYIPSKIILFHFVFINLILNLIIFVYYASVNFYYFDRHYNLYIDGFNNNLKYLRRQKNIIGSLAIIFTYSFFFIDFIYNFIFIFSSCFNHYTHNQKYSKKDHKWEDYKNFADSLTDLYIIILFIFEVFLYKRYNNNILVCSFFLWRITAILIFKLREIINIGIKDIDPIVSFPRTFLILLINFVEINLVFSYLYQFFKLDTSSDKFGLLLKNLLFFTSLNFDKDIIYSCTTQKWILFFQIITFFIFVIVFVANIANLKREKK